MSRGNIGLRTRVSCPFNPAHVMNYSKFHQHLVKCRKQYPDDKRKSCPYNFSELIEPDEMEKHLGECQYRWDYGTRNAVDDYSYTPIKAPYNIDFGPDNEWHRRVQMNNDNVDPDEDIDSVSVYDESVTSRRHPETDTESYVNSYNAKLESLGRGGEPFSGSRNRLISNHDSEYESYSGPTKHEGKVFTFLTEENIRPGKKQAGISSRSESVSSLESSPDDNRMAILRKLRADAINESPCEHEVPKKGRGRAEIFGYHRRN